MLIPGSKYIATDQNRSKLFLPKKLLEPVKKYRTFISTNAMRTQHSYPTGQSMNDLLNRINSSADLQSNV
jgi:hypothetical protein